MKRKISDKEKMLLRTLINLNLSEKINTFSYDDLLVESLSDGGMGSLRLFPCGSDQSKREFGMQLSEVQFFDKDGVRVSASLNIDQDGDIYELDIWKTDFSNLIEIPDSIGE